MNIGVMGVNFVNKGAELMLTSIIQEVATWPEHPTVALPLHTGSRSQRSAARASDLLVKTFRHLRPLDPMVMALGNIIPKAPARWLHLVRARDLDLVLDASGFAYSDQWGLARIEQHARLYRALAQAGKPIVLMPQALGPFESEPRRRAFREIAESAALVFARDPVSAAYARDAAPGIRINVAPDFTASTTAASDHPKLSTYAGRPCLIPNLRMLDKVPVDAQTWYLTVLTDVHRRLRGAGLTPFFLLFERRDASVIDGLELEVVDREHVLLEPDPLMIKSVIGSAQAVVGSRYHGLASALALGVPSVGIGWSHKYDALFDDYGCPEMLVRAGAPVDRAMSGAFESSRRDELVATLVRRGAEIRAKTIEMWSLVRRLIPEQGRGDGSARKHAVA